MEHLVEVVQALAMAHDLEAVMAITRAAARDLTGADGATFVLRDGDQCFYADENAISPLWKGHRFPIGLCVSGWAMINRQPVVIEDVFNDPRVPVEAYRPTFVRSLAMVPIRTRDPVGAIGNYWARTYRPTPQQLAILQALADTTAVAMENVRVWAELEARVRERTLELEAANDDLRREVAERRKAEEEVRRLSTTDDLTGLYNRRGFMLLAERQLSLARRTGMAAVLVFADADGLKQVNDSQGHQAGDQLIVAAAQALKAAFRDADTVARLGGDEFAVLAVGNPDDPEAMRRRLQEQVRRTGAEFGVDLALSIGMIPCPTADERPLDALLTVADQAMYADKQARRAGRP